MKSCDLKRRLVSLLLAAALAACVVLSAASCSSGYDLNIGGGDTNASQGRNDVNNDSPGGSENGENGTGDNEGKNGGENGAGGDVSGVKPAKADTSKVIDWSKAIDGMILETINGDTFTGYVLLIRDASRVSVGIKETSFSSASRIYEIVEQYGAVAAINGGEFPDDGYNTGSTPIGLTYSGGECVWDDGYHHTFLGFTSDDTLVVEEGTSHDRADSLGVRDAVSFQTGNTLISTVGGETTYYYAGENEETGVSQRTAIAQLADGTVMFLVTDGRTSRSLGATRNDIIDVLREYGAVTAGMLDGGSSAMLWYRDWFDKYPADKSLLDTWQNVGLVNIFKAFTNPRAMPTYFIVAPDGGSSPAPASSAASVTVIEVPEGFSVTVDGTTLGESFVAERFTFPDAEQLPASTSGISFVRYALEGAPSSHKIEVKTPGGAAASVHEVNAGTYRADLLFDDALGAEVGDYVIEALSRFSLMMSADGSWSNVRSYFDPDSRIYGETYESAQYTWTVYDHENAEISDASATDFVRISDDVFMCRVRLTNTLTRNGEKWYDRIDWTVVFHNVGGRWLICGMMNNA